MKNKNKGMHPLVAGAPGVAGTLGAPGVPIIPIVKYTLKE